MTDDDDDNNNNNNKRLYSILSYGYRNYIASNEKKNIGK